MGVPHNPSQPGSFTDSRKDTGVVISILLDQILWAFGLQANHNLPTETMWFKVARSKDRLARFVRPDMGFFEYETKVIQSGNLDWNLIGGDRLRDIEMCFSNDGHFLSCL